MSMRFGLESNNDGSYNILIQYDSREEAEFGLDFFSPENIKKHKENIGAFIQKKYKGVAIKTAKIVVGGIIIATIPFSSLTAAAANKYSMSYFNGGSISQQISYVNRTNNNIQTVAPSYFDLNANGSLKLNMPGTQLIEEMHKQNIRVVPYLSNHWDRTTGENAVKNYKSLAAEIATAIEKYNLDGINVDIENVTHVYKREYTALVTELRRLIPSHKEVSVAVAANPNGWTTGWHGSYDYAALAEQADYLLIMAYDEHWNGSAAGPVASIGFVERSVQYALKHAPADKIVLGIPFFGRIWSDNGQFNGHGLNISTVNKLLENHTNKVTLDANSQSPKAEFTVKAGDPISTIGGSILRPGQYTVWYENDASIESKLGLVQKYDLKGAGAWALGQEPGTIWNNYNTWLNGRPSGGGSTSSGSTGSSTGSSTTQNASSGIALRINSKKAIVNHKVTTIDSNGSSPYTLNGRTLIPLRFTSEKMGAKVSWTANNKPITIRYGGVTIRTTVGSRTLSVTKNGKTSRITLDQAPTLRNGRVYVPLRAVAEQLGFSVKYDNASRVIVMTESPLSSSQLSNWIGNTKSRI